LKIIKQQSKNYSNPSLGLTTLFIGLIILLIPTSRALGQQCAFGPRINSINIDARPYSSSAPGPIYQSGDRVTIIVDSVIEYCSSQPPTTLTTITTIYEGASGDTSNPVYSIPRNGAAFAIYSTPPLTKTTSYWARITATAGNFPSAVKDSNAVTVTVTPAPSPTPSPTSKTVQFQQSNFNVGENDGRATVTVTRSGDLAATASVNYATSDSAGSIACGADSTGKASERCDYATVLGTLSFAAGQQSATFNIPVIDDTYAEGAETFTVSLSNAVGAAIGSQSSATVTIIDNDTATSIAPTGDVPFFVRQQYLDFFSREPDSTGYANWQQTLSQCPGGGYGEFNNPSCDRVHISAAFYQSDEFQSRGYFVYRFYQIGLGRRPTYAEFVPDMVRIGGSQSPEQEAIAKAAYTTDFVQRAEFTTKYNQGQYADAAAYVRELERVAGVVVANEGQLISNLQAGTQTRGQVLRAVAESSEVFNKYYNQAFVAMQYFGYLKRDPDQTGFANWVQTLDTSGDYRHMIFGFLYSAEYRSRFGTP